MYSTKGTSHAAFGRKVELSCVISNHKKAYKVEYSSLQKAALVKELQQEL